MNDLDKYLMLSMNFSGGAFLDSVMWFASGKLQWAPLYLLVMFLIYRRFGWKYMLFALLFLVAGVVISDHICNIFKHNIEYLRPTRAEDMAPLLHTVNGHRGGGLYGTVSGHASTTFSIFLFSSLLYKRRWFTAVMLTYALMVSYSRIYLGVHYPFQVFFGIILGAVVAFSLWLLFVWLNRKFRWLKEEPGKLFRNRFKAQDHVRFHPTDDTTISV